MDNDTNQLRVVVASHNPVKIAAVQQAFTAAFAETQVVCEPVSVESGVADQPSSDAETRRGASNRAAAAAKAIENADYWVGLEGGIDRLDGQMIAFAWMAIRASNGHISEARSVTLPLPGSVRDLVDGGMELGEANDQIFATSNSKQGGGAFGLLSDGLYTRESVYCEALTMALVPFIHESFRA